MNQTEADFFPNLKESILKAHAIIWANYYPKLSIKDDTTSKVIDEIIRIQRIVLYKAGLIQQTGVKYVVVFELPEIPGKYKEMVWYSDVLEQMIDFPDGPPFVSKEFYNEVYNKQPDGNLCNEWLFKWIRPCGDLDVDVIEGSKTVLLQDTCKQAKNKPKLRPNQKDKIKCRKIAKEIWPNCPILDKAHISKLPEIIKIVGTKFYKDPDTVPDWIKEEDPLKGSRRTGRRSRKTLLEQKKICEKLGIKHDFKL